MKSKARYTSWLSDDALAFTLSLSKSRRRKIMEFSDAIAAHPFRLGDYQSTDEIGHVIENILVDEFIFSYWVDHAVKEVRITEIVIP